MDFVVDALCLSFALLLSTAATFLAYQNNGSRCLSCAFLASSVLVLPAPPLSLDCLLLVVVHSCKDAFVEY